MKQFKLPFELTQQEINIIENLYMRIWKEKGSIGGAAVWFETIAAFLHTKEYKIEKGDQPPNGETV